MIRVLRAAAAALVLALLFTAAPRTASAQLLSLDLSVDGIVSDLLPDVEIELPLSIDISVGSDPDEPPAGGGGGGNPNVNNGVVPMPQAVQAVTQQRAIPLNDLLRIVPRYVDGQVIDVALVSIENSLYYQVKLLNRAGVVFQTYFDAATGVPVAF
ncbi:MAG: PepSY domain-containing protein [Bauldia sp.]